MKYYIVAGEASGDVHGANLIKSIKKEDPKAEIRAWGGDLMRNQGADLVKHYKDTAYMGIFEVLMNLKKILGFIKECKQDILNYNPDAVILIDYPGFNFKIAKFAHEKNYKTLYYIAPKIWAWKTGRIKRIKAFVDRVYSILPFEKAFYQKYDYEKLDYVGNPILDNIELYKSNSNITKESFIKEHKLDEKKDLVAILCGSRVQEINHLLPTILETVEKYDDRQFVVAGLTSVNRKIYDRIIENKNVTIIFDKTYDLLSVADSAIVASGTASLETALFDVPHVVVYKMLGGQLIHRLGKIFIKVKYASLVNLITDRESVKELLQADFTKQKLGVEIEKLFYDQKYIDHINNEYAYLHKLMGQPGASDMTAKLMIQEIKK
jgi:lipid-A-disaccharide synthase